MGKQLFKAEITYNDNWAAPTSETLYMLCICTNDYNILVDEQGCPVKCEGTDSYIDKIVKVLTLEEYEGHDGSVKITELEDWVTDVPQSVREYLFGPANNKTNNE